jgi:arabinogalactan oligomer/maltooligosaccharide transport system permease protein
MKKAMIGLNVKYFLHSLIGAAVMFLCLFLPYVRREQLQVSFITGVAALLRAPQHAGTAWILYLTVALSIASFVFGIVNFCAITVRGYRIWQWIQVGATIGWTLLMFTSKMIWENSGLVHGFLNRQLSVGYWVGLVASYVALIFIMRTTMTNRGYIILVIMSIIWMFPILWILLTALRAEQGYYVGYFFPKHLTLKNFTALFAKDSIIPFAKWWVNTFIVAICACVLNTLIILATSFILSRTRFRGRKMFMNILMIIGLFPGFMALIAVYNILKGLGLNQSLLALIVVGAAGAAMGYHVSKGFFDTIPRAIDEAAIIDGASRLQIFTHITLPLSKSIIVYQALGAFLGAWSDYIFPSMLFGDKQSSYTVAVGLYWLTDFRRIDTYYTQFAAGAVIVAIPIVILFVWLQRFYVEGLSGSVKG